MEIERPSEFIDFLAYIVAYAPNDYPYEDQLDNCSAFGDAFRALNLFIASARREEGRERLRECLRHLEVAYEFYENGDDICGAQFVQETERMFHQCRRYISISDE